MTARYLVARAGQAGPVVPGPLAGHSAGYRRWPVVDEAAAVHTGDLDAVLDRHADDIVMFDVPPPRHGKSSTATVA